MKLCKKLGLKNSSVSKQSKHLSYTHPAMEAVRRFVDKVTSTNYVDGRLVANFDQVWSVHYEPPRKQLHKPEEDLGKLVPHCPSRSFQKIITQLLVMRSQKNASSRASQ